MGEGGRWTFWWEGMVGVVGGIDWGGIGSEGRGSLRHEAIISDYNMLGKVELNPVRQHTV